MSESVAVVAGIAAFSLVVLGLLRGFGLFHAGASATDGRAPDFAAGMMWMVAAIAIGIISVAMAGRGWITRLFRTLGDEQEELRDYERAVIDGGYLIAVPADAGEEKQRIADVFTAAGGEQIRYYDRNTVERL